MLDLLGLRSLSDQTDEEPLTATPCSDNDDFRRENDLLAAGRETHNDGLYLLAAPTWRGLPAKNPLVMALTQHLDKTALWKAAVRQSHRPQAGWRGESARQGGRGQAIKEGHVRGRDHDPV